MPLTLDDIGAALYKRLKRDSDRLSAVKAMVKSKKKLVEVLTEEWLLLEACEADDEADRAYAEKCKVELDLRRLEQEERALVTKIGKIVSKAKKE
jgi:hypothetical protein